MLHLRHAGVILAAVHFSVGLSVALADEQLYRLRLDVADGPATAEELERLGFDVMEGSVAPGSLEVVTTVFGMADLEAMGHQPVLLSEGRPFREIQDELDVPVGYSDLDEILAQMAQMAADHPAICRVVNVTQTFGGVKTFEGRDIFALKISDNVAQNEDEPQALIVAAHHCREIVTPVIAMTAAENLTTLYGGNPDVTNAVNNYEIWIAPVWNPDGYEYVFNVQDLWRKNRRVFTQGVGVDLNRNYPFGWSAPCAGSTNPNSDTYKGPSAGSEAETQTLMAFSEDRRFAKIMDYHSSGREALYAYSCLSHPWRTFMSQEAADFAAASGYGSTSTRLPSAEGEHYEWQLATKGSMAMLMETHTEFQPPFNSAVAEANLVWPGIMWFLKRPIALSGHVTDADGGSPVEANIRFIGVNFPNGETSTSDPATGRYHAFPAPGAYNVEFSATGFVAQTRSVTIASRSSSIVVDVALSRENRCPGSAKLKASYKGSKVKASLSKHAATTAYDLEILDRNGAVASSATVTTDADGKAKTTFAVSCSLAPHSLRNATCGKETAVKKSCS